MLQVLGIKTDLIRPGDDLAASLEKAMAGSGLALQDGDILVVSESTVATAEGRVVSLHDVVPGTLARTMAARYGKDPREMELILQESDEILGGIPGVVLTLREGFLYPNAGIDNSNAPPGHVVLFPADAQKSALEIRERMAKGRRQLRDAYRFPGFVPLAQVHGIFGAPKARIVRLRRRRKKRPAASVEPGRAAFTIDAPGWRAICPAACCRFTWSSRFGAWVAPTAA